MFCEQCGNQIVDGDAFCQECGWKVTVETVEIEVKADAEVADAKVDAKPTKTETNAVDGQQFFSAPEKDELVGPAVDKPVVVTPVTAPAATPAEEPMVAPVATPAEEPMVAPVATPAEEPMVASVAEPMVAPVVEGAMPGAGAMWSSAGGMTPAMDAGVPTPDAPKKKSKKGLFITLGVVALIGILVAVNYARIVNFFHKTFSSPEEYYQYIEAKQVDELVDTYMNGYESYMDMISFDDKGISVEYTVELGEDLRDLLEMTDVDVSWLEKINYAMDASIKDEALKLEALVGVNDVDILSGNIIMDFAEEYIYMQYPELNEQYIGASFDEIGVDYEEGMFEIIEVYKEYFPESEELEDLLKKYITIVLEQIDDVEEETVTLEVGDVSQKCTALEVTIDTETAQKIIEAVMEELSKDEDLEKMLKKCMGIAEEMGVEDADVDELYDEFMDEIDYALEHIDEIDMGDVEIVMVVYVNGKGEVIGREIEVEDFKYRYAMPREGSSFEMECYIEMPDVFSYSYYDTYAEEPQLVEFGIEGEGKVKGGKITGDFSVKYDSTTYLDIKVEGYNTKKAKDGEMEGTFTFTLPKSVKSMLTEGMGAEVALVAGFLDYGIEIDMDTDSDGGTVSIAVVDDEEFLVKLTLETESGKAEKISIPSSKEIADPMDEDEMEEWVEDIEWDDILKKLEKADVDEEYIEMIEDFIDELN